VFGAGLFSLIKRVSPQFHSYETKLTNTAASIRFKFNDTEFTKLELGTTTKLLILATIPASELKFSHPPETAPLSHSAK
jgi:hypothetical protein